MTSQLDAKSLRRYKNFSKISSTTELTIYHSDGADCEILFLRVIYNTILQTKKAIMPICLYIYHIYMYGYILTILVSAHDLDEVANVQLPHHAVAAH